MTKKPETAFFIMPLDMISSYNTKAFEQFKASSTQMVSFVTKRVQEDMALPQKFANCKDPIDMMTVWADFYSTAFSDYTEQSKKVVSLVQQAAAESQATAKDVVEASKAAIEQTTDQAA